VGDHDYAVVGYNASAGLLELLNPWGGTTSSDLCPQDNQVYGLFYANASFVAANFTTQSIGAGTAVPSGEKSTGREARQPSIHVQVFGSSHQLSKSRQYQAEYELADGDNEVVSSSGVFVG
jgi:hypothetical protein